MSSKQYKFISIEWNGGEIWFTNTITHCTGTLGDLAGDHVVAIALSLCHPNRSRHASILRHNFLLAGKCARGEKIVMGCGYLLGSFLGNCFLRATEIFKICWAFSLANFCLFVSVLNFDIYIGIG